MDCALKSCTMEATDAPRVIKCSLMVTVAPVPKYWPQPGSTVNVMPGHQPQHVAGAAAGSSVELLLPALTKQQTECLNAETVMRSNHPDLASLCDTIISYAQLSEHLKCLQRAGPPRTYLCAHNEFCAPHPPLAAEQGQQAEGPQWQHGVVAEPVQP